MHASSADQGVTVQPGAVYSAQITDRHAMLVAHYLKVPSAYMGRAEYFPADHEPTFWNDKQQPWRDPDNDAEGDSSGRIPQAALATATAYIEHGYRRAAREALARGQAQRPEETSYGTQ